MKNWKGRHVPARLLLSACAVILLLPVVLTILYSFFSPAEIKELIGLRNNYSADAMMEIRLVPDLFSLSQYWQVLISDTEILHYFCNSVFYTALILLGQALLLPAMAFSLSCFRYRGRDAIAFAVILLMLLPFQVTMVPNVLTLRTLGLLDTVWAVVLPMAVSPFTVFLLRQYMMGIPKELLEAAQIDGAGAGTCFLRIVLPVCKPVISTAAALSFAECWNLVEQPLTYLTTRTDLYPLSVAFGQLTTKISGNEFAGAALYILPALLIYLFCQDDILEGIQMTDLK